MSDPQPVKKRSRITLVLLIGVFVAPILLAYIVHKNKSLQPESKSTGTIISPARALPDFSLKTQNGNEFQTKDIRGKWSFVYVLNGVCDENCKLTLLKTRNAKLAQGAEGTRVNYYLLSSHEIKDQAVLEQFVKEHPKMIILFGAEAELEKIFNTFKDDKVKSVKDAQRVYLLDPAANYMMFFETGFNPLGIMEDLKLLLKASQIG